MSEQAITLNKKRAFYEKAKAKLSIQSKLRTASSASVEYITDYGISGWCGADVVHDQFAHEGTALRAITDLNLNLQLHLSLLAIHRQSFITLTFLCKQQQWIEFNSIHFTATLISTQAPRNNKWTVPDTPRIYKFVEITDKIDCQWLQ